MCVSFSLLRYYYVDNFSVLVSYSEVQLNILTAVGLECFVHIIIVCHMLSIIWAIFREKHACVCVCVRACVLNITVPIQCQSLIVSNVACGGCTEFASMCDNIYQ